jgi:hypothetical protein
MGEEKSEVNMGRVINDLLRKELRLIIPELQLTFELE